MKESYLNSIVEKNLLNSKTCLRLRPGNVVVVESVSAVTKRKSQSFEGIVISKRGRGLNLTFTIRRVLLGFGMDYTFQLHSPLISAVIIKRSIEVRRAKLYYLRSESQRTGPKRN